jgi:hypothetical protein
LQKPGNEGSQRFNAVARSEQHDDRNRKGCAILLMFEIPVGSNQDVELLARAPEKFPVAEPRPPGLLRRAYLVAR